MTLQELNNKYQEFKNKYNGKYTDYDGAYGYQCWDLAQRYFVEYLGVPEWVLSGSGLVSNMLNRDRDELNQYFEEISVYEMCPGDVVIWEWGHIAIYDGWRDNQNWYFSQNPNPCQVMNLRQDGQHAFRLKWVTNEIPKVEEPKQENIVEDTRVKELEEQVKLKDEEIKVLQERILELTEQRDIVLKNQPTLIYTAPKNITGRIKLKKDEQLYIKKN